MNHKKKQIYILLLVLFQSVNLIPVNSQILGEKLVLTKEIIVNFSEKDVRVYEKGFKDEWEEAQEINLDRPVVQVYTFINTFIIEDESHRLHIYQMKTMGCPFEFQFAQMIQLETTEIIRRLVMRGVQLEIEYQSKTEIYQKQFNEREEKGQPNKPNSSYQLEKVKRIMEEEMHEALGSNGESTNNIVISYDDFIPDAGREIVDMVMLDGKLITIQEYGKARFYNGPISDYQFTGLSQEMFLTQADINAEEGLIVLGSFDKIAHIYKDFQPFLNITTNSQISTVDLNPSADLLLGHMDGQISLYSWDGSTFQTSNNFADEGSRVLGVKLCQDKRMVILRQKLGWFLLQLRNQDGDVLDTIELSEFIGVEMAATDDCSKIVVSKTMSMSVQVYIQSGQSLIQMQVISEDAPLGKIALSPGGNILLVSKYTAQTSAIYNYDKCDGNFVFEENIHEGGDDSAVQITDSQIGLGNLDGSVKIYSYSLVGEEEVCEAFGKKQSITVSEVNSVSAPRAITSLTTSGNYFFAASKYSGIFAYQKINSQFTYVLNLTSNIFISDIALDGSLNIFAVGTYDRSVLIYRLSLLGLSQAQTIPIHSQVTHLDLRSEGDLFVGMINGDVAEFSWDGSSFLRTSSKNFSSDGRMEGLKGCPMGFKIVLIETNGVFSLRIFNSTNDLVQEFTTQLEDEFVGATLDATPDCSTFVVSGILTSKIYVFKYQDTFSFSEAIDVGEPLSMVSIEQDGDLLLVSCLTSQASHLYHYTTCQGGYLKVKSINSGTYDEANIITPHHLIQGNEDGGIKISAYKWVFDSSCLKIQENSDPLREKVGGQNYDRDGVEKAEVLEEKMHQEGEISQKQKLACTVVVGALLLILIAYGIWKGGVKKQQKQKDDSAKEIESNE